MPVPPFDIHGVIPPFLGLRPTNGADLSPYRVSPVEVVSALGTTPDRRDILRKWLQHRAQLRALGMTGFQWLNGSFTEKKNPNDLDIASFLRRPPTAQSLVDFKQLVQQNPTLFNLPLVKSTFRLDAYFVDLNGSPDTIVEFTRYFGGLFAHRRWDYLWKGMLRVELTNSTTHDATATVELDTLHLLATPTRGVS